jgi:hypothetical protein
MFSPGRTAAWPAWAARIFYVIVMPMSLLRSSRMGKAPIIDLPARQFNG